MVAPQRVPAGIRFKEAGKVYYFDAGDFDLQVGTFVVVDTSHGQEIGRVVVAPDQVVASEIKDSLKPIRRLADPEDLERSKASKKRAEEQLEQVKRCVAEDGANVRVVTCEYSLDGTEMTCYFTAEERSDYRSVSRALSEEMGVKVHMLQIGERDRAKIIDGIGRCGERLCCSSWMTTFPTVSIKQAKEQDLPLNPSKLSGACGRLLCCLTYEYDQYRKIKGGIPKAGARISTPSGNARVLKINVPKETITLSVEGEPENVDMSLTDFRLMYGTALRPKELTQKFEKDLMEKDVAENGPAPDAQKSPAQRPPERSQRRRGGPREQGRGGPPPGSRAAQKSGLGGQANQGGQPGQQAQDDKPKRRRRRRGGRRRGKGGGGGGGGSGGGGTPQS